MWKTALYAIYDPATHQLDAWELVGGRHRPATRTDEGDVVVPILGMRLGLRDLELATGMLAPSLRWIGPDGSALPSYEALVDRTAHAESRAAHAESRAAEAEARAAALEAEVARLRSK